MATWDNVHTRMQGGTPAANVWTPKGNGIPKPQRGAAIAEMYRQNAASHGGWDMHPGGRPGGAPKVGLSTLADPANANKSVADLASLGSMNKVGRIVRPINEPVTNLGNTLPNTDNTSQFGGGRRATAPNPTTGSTPLDVTANRTNPVRTPLDGTSGVGSAMPPVMGVPGATPTGVSGARNPIVRTPTTGRVPTAPNTDPGEIIGDDPGEFGPGNPERVRLGGPGGLGSPGYGINVSEFLDPAMAFRLQEGMRALENSAATAGGLMSGDTLRSIQEFAQGLASTENAAAWQRAANVRDFNYGMDRDDRNFDYTVQLGDRNFDYTRLRDLAQMGLQASGQANTGSTALAGMIATLLQNVGQINAAGTMGQSNGINNAISQLIAYLTQNNMLNTLGLNKPT